MSTLPDRSQLSHYLAILRHNSWVVALTVAVLVAAAVVLSLRQTELYEASADVFLEEETLNLDLDTVQQLTADPERGLQTQAQVAELPVVQDQARAALGLVRGTSRIHGMSAGSPGNADLLTFRVTATSKDLASRGATAYAKAYTDYRRRLDTGAIVRARRGIEGQLRQLGESDRASRRLVRELRSKEQQLRTAEALEGSNASLVRSGEDAAQIQPKPARNALLGGFLGVLLGVGLAFVRDALSTRIRSAEEAEERVGHPLLGRIPPPKDDREGITMLANPDTPEAESFRILATNIDFMNLDRGAKVLSITSAHRGEGKSTTMANLAVCFARQGRRVVLVDLDLRRPAIPRLFGIARHPGLTNVALGQLSLDEALVSLKLPDQVLPTATGSRAPLHPGARSQVVDEAPQGTLSVLQSGPLPPNPGEFVGSGALSILLTEVADRADVVLVDAPPMLHVSDALTLSAKVDAMLVVARLPNTRRPALDALRRALEGAPVVKLGLIVTGEGTGDDYYGPYSYGYTPNGKRGFSLRGLWDGQQAPVTSQDQREAEKVARASPRS